ncbi:MAG: HlyD family efflux transporter periplasmic adaptor subunit [Firmicutes bacterium]|nr:HlyD family efflux transporter periplasmic adaptor subunit [Bacillota bacterium]
MRPKRRILVVILLSGLLILNGGCKREAEKGEATASPVMAETPKIVEAFGVVKARDYKDINLDFLAQIVEVPVKDGQNVTLGEPLIHLNINDYQAMIKNKENELNLARFELLKMKKNLQDAYDAYDKAQRQLVDKENLHQEGVISEKELDDFRDFVKEREKIVTDIQVSLEQGNGINGIAVQTERVSVLDYDLQRMKNKLNQSFLKGNVIISDYSKAVVYEISCAAGYTVGVGENQQKLLSIMNLDSLYVLADVAEEFIKDVKLDKKATIIPVADNSRKYYGKVIRIADMAFQKNGETNVTVEISIDEQDGFLRPNFNVDVEIER